MRTISIPSCSQHTLFICYQVCIQAVYLSTQVGDMIVQRLAPPICYLCVRCRWFICSSPLLEYTISLCVKTREKHMLSQTIKTRKLEFVSVSIKDCWIYYFWLNFKQKWKHKKAGWYVWDACAGFLKQHVASLVGTQEKKKKKEFCWWKKFFFSFVSHFIFCFLKEKSFVILLNLLTFQTQSSHSARYLRLVNSEGGLSAVHNLGSLLTWVGGEFLRN